MGLDRASNGKTNAVVYLPIIAAFGTTDNKIKMPPFCTTLQ